MTASWAETEFSNARLGDVRRTQRLIKIATARGQQPSASLLQCFENEAQLDGMYKFCSNKHVEHHAILKSHYEATTKRIREHKIVLVHQHTTYVNYTHHPATPNLGILHDDKHTLCIELAIYESLELLRAIKTIT